jgi:DNA repair protein RecN (Recombination protein N)
MLRQLGEQLVDIHGQHEHQSLMKKELQRSLLDDYAENQTLLAKTNTCFTQWKSLHDKLESLSNQNSDHQAKLDLLRFQTQELDELNLNENEADELDNEHALLANAGTLLEISSNGVNQLYDDDERSIYSAINGVISQLEEGVQLDNKLSEPLEILQNCQIQIQEVTDQLRRYQESIGLDPERLEWLNKRISTLHTLSRKHQTTPKELFNKWQALHTQLDELSSDDYDIDTLQEKCEASALAYENMASQLSKARSKAASQLAKGVSEAMQTLGMQGGMFAIKIKQSETYASHWLDQIEFQVSANPGQPLKPLAKVASGGELSRISLAIQMIAAQRVTLPALIFDEVDSGIGGGIAEVVGQQLRKLGANRQVLCVTHLPQVASQAHHHFKVTKIKETNTTSTGMIVLNKKQRINELARMMGGLEITQSTLNLAEEMLRRKVSS